MLHYATEPTAAVLDADRVVDMPGARLFLLKAAPPTDAARGLTALEVGGPLLPGQVDRGWRLEIRRPRVETNPLGVSVVVTARGPWTPETLRQVRGFAVVERGETTGTLYSCSPMSVQASAAEPVWRFTAARVEDAWPLPVAEAPEGLPYSLPFTLA